VKKNIIGPVLIHVVTQKGKGYEFAEDDAARFHGLGPYEIETGESVTKSLPTYSHIFGDTLCEIATRNKKVVAITAAMTDGTGLTKYAEKYPERFFDVGIAEQHAVTFAGGLAIQGIKPFIAIYSTFLQRALDQVIHDIALQKLPVVFCMDRAGLVGEDGATHHGAFDLSYLNLIPNMIIMAPANAEEFSEMMKFAANYWDGPIAIRYPRGSAKYIKKDLHPLTIGEYEIISKGKNIAIFGIGNAFNDAEILFDKIKKEFPEISPYLVNARFLKPLDEKFLNRLKKNVNTIITIEENSRIGGFGSIIKDYFSENNIKIHSFGIPDQFVTHGKMKELKKLIKLSPEQIFSQIKKIL